MTTRVPQIRVWQGNDLFGPRQWHWQLTAKNWSFSNQPVDGSADTEAGAWEAARIAQKLYSK